MIKELIESFNNRGNESPFEVGKWYYNEAVGDKFRVDGIQPEFRATYSKFGESLWYDHDIYKWKYDEGVIREIEDDAD